jgi:hypothetical protein
LLPPSCRLGVIDLAGREYGIGAGDKVEDIREAVQGRRSATGHQVGYLILDRQLPWLHGAFLPPGSWVEAAMVGSSQV